VNGVSTLWREAHRGGTESFERFFLDAHEADLNDLFLVPGE